MFRNYKICECTRHTQFNNNSFIKKNIFAGKKGVSNRFRKF